MTIVVNHVLRIVILTNEDRLFVNVMKDSFDSILRWKIPNVLVRDKHPSSKWIDHWHYLHRQSNWTWTCAHRRARSNIRTNLLESNQWQSLSYWMSSSHTLWIVYYLWTKSNKYQWIKVWTQCFFSLSLCQLSNWMPFDLVCNSLVWMRILIIESRFMLNRLLHICLVKPLISHLQPNDRVRNYLYSKKKTKLFFHP